MFDNNGELKSFSDLKWIDQLPDYSNERWTRETLAAVLDVRISPPDRSGFAGNDSLASKGRAFSRRLSRASARP